MDRLEGAEEQLDGPLRDPAALDANLLDLRRINRLLGGVALSRWGLERLVDGLEGTISLLDVGTGGADIPVALLADARRRDRRLSIVAVDSRPEVIASALRLRPSLSRIEGLTLGVVPESGLPYPDRAFDVAHCSLVVHHLERGEAIAFLGELGRVARRGVVVNDLDRSWRHWLGARLVGSIAGSPYTRSDAPLSVRRAYRPSEQRGLLEAAGLRVVAERRGFLGHRYVLAAVHHTDEPAGASV